MNKDKAIKIGLLVIIIAGVRHMSASNANITVTFGEEKQKTFRCLSSKN